MPRTCRPSCEVYGVHADHPRRLSAQSRPRWTPWGSRLRFGLLDRRPRSRLSGHPPTKQPLAHHRATTSPKVRRRTPSSKVRHPMPTTSAHPNQTTVLLNWTPCASDVHGASTPCGFRSPRRRPHLSLSARHRTDYTSLSVHRTTLQALSLPESTKMLRWSAQDRGATMSRWSTGPLPLTRPRSRMSA